MIRLSLTTTLLRPFPTVTLDTVRQTLLQDTAVSDVTCSGTVRRISGSIDETGSVLLRANVGGSSRIEFSLPSGNRTEIINFTTATPVGVWTGPDGVGHPIPWHNLVADSFWFFPGFEISRRVSASFVTRDLGLETRNGLEVEHFVTSEASPTETADEIVEMQHLTQVDFYVDVTSNLPTAITFNLHPDDNSLQDIPVEFRLFDYRTIGGTKIPFHVQKFLNNDLFLDFEIHSSSINSGVAADQFSIH